MGIRKAIVGAVKVAAKGGSATEVVKAGVVGAAPRGTKKIVGKIADKVVTDQNIDRVKSGVKEVVDKGRNAAFSDSAPRRVGGPTPPSAPTTKPRRV
jgi:hypothetical protein